MDLTDKAGKTAVGASDRVGKTGIGAADAAVRAPGKVVKKAL